MPYDLFWWEGLDGSRVLAHTFNNPVGGYNAEIGAARHRRDLEELPRQAPPPREPARLRLRRRRRRPDRGDARPPAPVRRLPRRARAPPGQGRRLVRRDPRRRRRRPRPAGLGRRDLPRAPPRHADHPGPHQVPAPPRRARADHRRDAVAAWRRCSATPTAASLEPHWRVLLRNEFHDILPGSSIREVYEEAERELAGVVAAGDARRRRPASTPSPRSVVPPGDRPGVLVVNPDLSPRPLRLASPDPLPGGQAVAGGSVLAGRRDRSPASPPRSSSTSRRRAPACRRRPTRLENALLRVEIAADGTLASVFDKRAGREALAGRGNQIWAYVDKPRNWDAWDIEENYARQGEEIAASARSRSSSAARTAPRSASPAASATARSSRPCRLWANSARLDIATDIDWHERRILLKARFPLAIRADHATFECAHGVIRRADPPQHLLGRRPLRGRRAPLRRPLRARLRRRAPQRRQVRPPRARQRARPQPAALAGLSRPARRRGPAELHLRALPARRRLADRRRPRRGRGPEPAAPRQPGHGRRPKRAGPPSPSTGLHARPQRLQAGRGRRRR